jgi:hypothetical protein
MNAQSVPAGCKGRHLSASIEADTADLIDSRPDYLSLADLASLALTAEDEARLAALTYHRSLAGDPCWCVDDLRVLLETLS